MLEDVCTPVEVSMPGFSAFEPDSPVKTLKRVRRDFRSGASPKKQFVASPCKRLTTPSRMSLCSDEDFMVDPLFDLERTLPVNIRKTSSTRRLEIGDSDDELEASFNILGRSSVLPSHQQHHQPNNQSVTPRNDRFARRQSSHDASVEPQHVNPFSPSGVAMQAVAEPHSQRQQTASPAPAAAARCRAGSVSPLAARSPMPGFECISVVDESPARGRRPSAGNNFSTARRSEPPASPSKSAFGVAPLAYDSDTGHSSSSESSDSASDIDDLCALNQSVGSGGGFSGSSGDEKDWVHASPAKRSLVRRPPLPPSPSPRAFVFGESLCSRVSSHGHRSSRVSSRQSCCSGAAALPVAKQNSRLGAFRFWAPEARISPANTLSSDGGAAHQPVVPSSIDDYPSPAPLTAAPAKYSKRQSKLYEDDYCTVYKVSRSLDGMFYSLTVIKEPVTQSNEPKLMLAVEALMAAQAHQGVTYFDCWKETKTTKSGREVQNLHILTELMAVGVEGSAAAGGDEISSSLAATEEALLALAARFERTLAGLHAKGIAHRNVSLGTVAKAAGVFKLGLFHSCLKAQNPESRPFVVYAEQDRFLLGLTLLESLGVAGAFSENLRTSDLFLRPTVEAWDTFCEVSARAHLTHTFETHPCKVSPRVQAYLLTLMCPGEMHQLPVGAPFQLEDSPTEEYIRLLDVTIAQVRANVNMKLRQRMMMLGEETARRGCDNGDGFVIRRPTPGIVEEEPVATVLTKELLRTAGLACPTAGYLSGRDAASDDGQPLGGNGRSPARSLFSGGQLPGGDSLNTLPPNVLSPQSFGADLSAPTSPATPAACRFRLPRHPTVPMDICSRSKSSFSLVSAP
ncbi:hypothetical protein DIPPA_04608 [Diplonema papillatum]|nr:hypothetical protein DIPPA_04608 [Diplonema papillatum]